MGGASACGGAAAAAAGASASGVSATGAGGASAAIFAAFSEVDGVSLAARSSASAASWNSGMKTTGGVAACGSSFGVSTFFRTGGCTIGRGGRTASFFFSVTGLSSRMMTLRVRVTSFLPVMSAWITSGSRT